MIRLILFAVVGLLAGLGGGSGIAILKAKKAHATVVAAQAKAAADSIAEHGAGATKQPADSATATRADEHETAAPNAGGPPVVSAEHPTGEKGAPAKASGGPPEAHEAAPPAATKPPATRVTEPTAATGAGGVHASEGPPPETKGAPPPVQLGRIFAAMTPRDAAKVMGQLDDADVRFLLSALNAKQAAAILANLPAERAAALSKAVLRGGVPQ